MNYFVVGFISIVVVGIMEVVKKFLPENVNAKVTSAISLGLGILFPVGYGIVTKTAPLSIIMYAVGVVGLTQTSYNFVFKLLKTLIEKLKSSIIEKFTKE